MYYSFYMKLDPDVERKWYIRFSNQYDKVIKERVPETKLKFGEYEGKIKQRGLDETKQYKVIDYVNNRSYGIVSGSNTVGFTERGIR